MRARKSLTIRRAGSKATKAGEATMTRIFSYTQPIEAEDVYKRQPCNGSRVASLLHRHDAACVQVDECGKVRCV